MELHIYGILLIVTVLSLSCEQALFYLIPLRGSVFYTFIMKLLLIFYLAWTVVFVVYVISISHKNVIKRTLLIPYSIVNIVLAIVILALPINFYYDGTVGYSSGQSVDFLSLICSLYSFIIYSPEFVFIIIFF